MQLSFAGISEDVVSVHVKWDISVSECYVVCFRGYIISNKSYKKKNSGIGVRFLLFSNHVSVRWVC